MPCPNRRAKLDAAIGDHEFEDALPGGGIRSAVDRLGEEVDDEPAIGWADRPQQMDDHQRPLAFPQVAEWLLAVAGGADIQIQQIVGDLECRTQIRSEHDQRVQVGFGP